MLKTRGNLLPQKALPQGALRFLYTNLRLSQKQKERKKDGGSQLMGPLGEKTKGSFLE